MFSKNKDAIQINIPKTNNHIICQLIVFNLKGTIVDKMKNLRGDGVMMGLTVIIFIIKMAAAPLLLLSCKAGAPRMEHYQLVRTLSADAVVTVL